MLKLLLVLGIFLLFFKPYEGKVWSLLGGYDSRAEAEAAAENMVEGGPYHFKIVNAL